MKRWPPSFFILVLVLVSAPLSGQVFEIGDPRDLDSTDDPLLEVAGGYCDGVNLAAALYGTSKGNRLVVYRYPGLGIASGNSPLGVNNIERQVIAESTTLFSLSQIHCGPDPFFSFVLDNQINVAWYRPNGALGATNTWTRQLVNDNANIFSTDAGVRPLGSTSMPIVGGYDAVGEYLFFSFQSGQWEQVFAFTPQTGVLWDAIFGAIRTRFVVDEQSIYVFHSQVFTGQDNVQMTRLDFDGIAPAQAGVVPVGNRVCAGDPAFHGFAGMNTPFKVEAYFIILRTLEEFFGPFPFRGDGAVDPAAFSLRRGRVAGTWVDFSGTVWLAVWDPNCGLVLLCPLHRFVQPQSFFVPLGLWSNPFAGLFLFAPSPAGGFYNSYNFRNAVLSRHLLDRINPLGPLGAGSEIPSIEAPPGYQTTIVTEVLDPSFPGRALAVKESADGVELLTEGSLISIPIDFTPPLNFAQFADGAGLFSQILLTNPDPGMEARAVITLKNSDGTPLSFDFDGDSSLTIPGADASGQIELTIPASGSRTLQTDGAGGLNVGSVRVNADKLISGTIIFGGTVGLAGVPASAALDTGFTTPFEVNTENGISTGVAVMNLENEEVTLDLELFDAQGNRLAGTQIVLTAMGQTARFVNAAALTWNPAVDFTDLKGVLRVTSSGRIAATVIQSRPEQFATLPVDPL